MSIATHNPYGKRYMVQTCPTPGRPGRILAWGDKLKDLQVAGQELANRYGVATSLNEWRDGHWSSDVSFVKKHISTTYYPRGGK